MNQEIKKILSDLYQVDESLKKHEKELLEIIEEFLANKPDAQFDDEFRGRLKAEILNRIELMRSEKRPESARKGIGFAFPLPNRFAYSLAGAFMMLILLTPFVYYGLNRNDGSQSGAELRFGSGIEKLAGGAFGELATDGGVVEDGAIDGGVAPMGESSQVMGLGGAEVDASRIGIPFMPDPIQYEYIYVGEEFSLSDNEVDVLRRKKDSTVGRDLSGLIGNAKIDMLNIANFKNTELSNLNIVEDREFGYNLYLDFRESMVSIFSNWQKWPRPEQNCGSDNACYERLRLKESDIPADERVIAIADAFAAEYGIDLSAFGPGEVQDNWRRHYDLMRTRGEAAELYIPDEISVLYPLLIDGKYVYENGGEKSGLNINVNIRHQKASGLNSLFARNYESSAYDAIIDAEKVLSMAREGGIRYQYFYDENAKTVRVELDTPQVSWLKHYKYDHEKGSSDELFIPAMIFPIKNFSELDANFYQKNVIVPLAREIFEQYEKDNDGPRILPIEPMPLKGNETEAVSEEINEEEEVGQVVEPEIIEEGEARGLPEPDMPRIQIED